MHLHQLHLPVVLAVYWFLQDPHEYVFRFVRWAAKTVIFWVMAFVVLMLLANIIVGIIHFGFHVPMSVIIATVDGWNAYVRHWRQWLEGHQL